MEPQSDKTGWLTKLGKVKGIEWIAFLIIIGAALLIIGPMLGGEPALPATTTDGGDQLETRVARVLSSVAGAGRVEVLITYESEATQPPAAGYWSTPAPVSAQARRVQGVVVVAEGASDTAVRMTLQQAVHTALNVPLSRVEVLPMQPEPLLN